MLTCLNITELVTDYLEGRLSFMDRLRFRMHIMMCKECREYLIQMKNIIKAVGKLPEEPIPEDIHDEMMKRFENWKGVTPS